MPKTIVIITLLVSLSACGIQKSNPDQDRLSVVVSITPYKDFVKSIGGDKVSVDVLIPKGASPHTFEPTTGELKKLYKADVYFKVGGNFHFEHELLGKITGNDMLLDIYDCSLGIRLIDNNPHIWLGPKEVRVIAKNINRKLKQILPADSNYFESNYRDFIKQLDSLDADIRGELESYKDKTFLVYHGAWIYLAKHYGVKELAIEAEGKEPGLTHMQYVVKEANELKLEYVYLSPGNNRESALAVAQEIDANIDTLETLPDNYLINLAEVIKKIKRDFK